MAITVEWSHIGIGSVIAFLVGWLIFGLLGAILIAIVVLVLMGVIRNSDSSKDILGNKKN
jgi:hypothetical protein